jgi:endonuclease YncB( thermonuclease family)
LISASAAAEGTFFKSRTASAPAQPPTTVPQTVDNQQKPTPPPTAPADESQTGSGADTGTVPGPTSEPAPELISGPIERVVTTSTFVVAGQQFELFGVIGEPAPYVDALSGWLNANGNRVECKPEGGKYRCFTPGKVDVGNAVIFNGAGKAAPDAPPEYVAAEQKAQAQRRGVWH